jgi:hypothetical protein
VDENLPPEDFQGAVILVCGDNTPLFVSGFRHRETRQGWYLWVKDAEQLPLCTAPEPGASGLVSQISVMLAVVPEQHISGDDFTQSCGAGSGLSSSAVRHLARSHRCGP